MLAYAIVFILCRIGKQFSVGNRPKRNISTPFQYENGIVSTGPRMYCIASKLFTTEGSGCRINGKGDQYNSGDEVQKVAKKRTSS